MQSSGLPGRGKYAWRELPRQDPPQRPALERVADFCETRAVFEATTAQAQAARCVQCALPFCTIGCPFDSRIPDWLELVMDGHFVEAATLVQSTGVLQEICAHLCLSAAPCESRCALSERSDPIPIAAIEEFVLQYARKQLPAPPTLNRPKGPKSLAVAIVGAGPAGLACADVLAAYGYGVTMFEASGILGGTLTSRIPSFKLERAVVEERLELLRTQGVTFRTQVTVGRDVIWKDLVGSFDAIFLATGALQPKRLEIPGAELRGVFQAVDFLRWQKLGEASQLSPISVADKRVVVLGGGDTAVDSLQTVLRCRPQTATGIYRRDVAQMPANRADFANVVEEGARFQFLAHPIQLVPNAFGGVAGVQCVRTQLGQPGSDGRPKADVVPGCEFVVPAEVVLVAYGFDPTPLPGADEERRFQFKGQGLCVDANQMTGVPGVFGGGELVHGSDLVINSVSDGYRAAHSIHRFLTRQHSANLNPRIGTPRD